MASRAEQQKNDLVDRLAARAVERIEKADPKVLERFIRAYFANVAPHDLLGKDLDSLYGAVVSLWSFARKRKPGQAIVRVFNPKFEEHGWHSHHTVIETVNDDMPFLVDSVTAELNRQERTAHLVIHPVMQVVRDAGGTLLDVEPGDGDAALESMMHIEVDEQTDPNVLKEIERRLLTVLADVRLAVEDWRLMRARALEILKELKGRSSGASMSEEETGEVRDFLQWLHDDHFTFLGYRDYTFPADIAECDACVRADAENALGILRDPETLVFDELRDGAGMPPYVSAFVQRPNLLLITKSNRRATVHRAVHMDAVGIKRLDEKGRVVGLRTFVGLFTADVYTNSPSFVPVLRRKVERCMKRAGFRPYSHDGKKLLNILENLPRDELFQTQDEELLEIALGILHLQERQRTALFIRRDEFERFVSCLVFVPRDRYDTAFRIRAQKILTEAFDGRISAFYTQVADSPLARLHFIVGTNPGRVPEADLQQLEARLAAAARSWADHLRDALTEEKGEEKGLALFARYDEAMPLAYRERFPAQAAIGDIDRIERVRKDGGLGMNLYRPLEAPDREVRFKLYHAGGSVALSDILPMLENMGFRVMGEVPFEIRPKGAERPVWIHDFGMETTGAADVDIKLGEVRARFQDAFGRIWTGEMENDGLNRLVLLAGLTWRDVVVLRAYAKFLRQAGIGLSQDYLEQALASHPAITALLVDLLHAQFDPEWNQSEGGNTLEARIRIEREILDALEDVANADQDRIIRRFLNLIRNTLRTNHYQTDKEGEPKPYLSLKLDSRGLDALPLPRPWVEVFVYSPRVEAVHLRGGKVARGGIRWSDRREDFRTEVLGLLKAQNVKNAVIVPVGAKGGFFVKRPPVEASREAIQEEGIACYRIMMQGLLDITDNLGPQGMIPPPDVVRADEDDPYLVVAADKGTATFSDIANGISQEYGFWLDDAFASGGSHGYDHKAMGITARGAWEAVKRHFRELGKDIQNQDFTVVGVGDMSGDVFGNGMLLSRHIKLLAAFNHMHIFIDPDPDPEVSFKERERLFKLSRSQWSDYEAKLLSRGGAIYERRAKTIKPTAEIRALFGIEEGSLTPNELIRHLLRAEADLLWFGGIGTYVRAKTESDAEVGDRANDAVRVTGAELRAKVVGEGANLGVTQRGRIEYALAGGRLNTDAIDNSAGVDCSDHEVNIKILLGAAVAEGDLTLKQRNQLLERMTDEVAALVLRNNYLQTQALSLVEAQGTDALGHLARLMRMLERQGRLNRAIEYLPDDEAVSERANAGLGLTRPENAVLMLYGKLWLYDEVLASDLPDTPFLVDELVRYFPTPLGKKFKVQMARHRLRREIIATSTTNSMINRVGGTFVTQMMEKTGMPPADIARAYLVARDAFSLRDVWEAVESLDTKVPAQVQTAMLLETTRLIERATLWSLRQGPHPIAIGDTVTDLRPGIEALRACLDRVMSEDVAEMVSTRAGEYEGQGVPEALAREVASLVVLASANDIQRITRQMEADFERVARIYFSVGARFGIGRLRMAAENLAIESHWQKLATAAVIEELYAHQRELSVCVLGFAPDEQDATEAVKSWAEANCVACERADQLMSEFLASGAVDLAMLTVASRQLRTMAGG